MDYPAAIWAGLIGGAAMTAVLYMGIFVMPGQMKMNLLYILGSMMFGERTIAYMSGAMMHATMSVAFALAHVGLYQAFGLEANLAAWGLVFGAAHWAMTGMALGMMPAMHPRIKDGTLAAPGPFAMGYPMGTAIGFLVLHLIFGVLVGALYETFI
ncbi:MAG: hypothetical protein O3A93_05690 [Chloroflexi bacterium]|nr:hypothetical protein [Chloroflexota bacterium]MDA1270733.1 hypothetical protein [Chloroflexota bacterium]PKB58146.1 MAG: hypothetical protein BZY83_08535 [SAR202 cluster bacterium Casp-Chloro-G2]